MQQSSMACASRVAHGVSNGWPGLRLHFVQGNALRPLFRPSANSYTAHESQLSRFRLPLGRRAYATEAKALAIEEERVLEITQTLGPTEQLPAVVNKSIRQKRGNVTPFTLAGTIASPTLPTQTVLRPYQQQVIDTCLAKLTEGVKRQIVSLPVGSGKTVIFSHLMKQVPPPFPGATKVLVLAHRQELLEQTKKHILSNGMGLTVTIDQGNKKADMNADVIVASVPTLGRAGTTRILQYDPRQFKCIIIDEAHHAAAASYGRILKHFGTHHKNTHIFLYGCSATVRRHDGLQLSGVFDYVSFHRDFLSMIEDKWLCGLRVSTIKTDFSLLDVKTVGGDFAQKDLALKVNIPIRNEIVVRSYMTYCGERHSTVVFAVDIAHLEALTAMFQQYGYDARGLSSKTDTETRAQLLHDFRHRRFPIIVNCGILTEGTDIPAIDSILMARPTKSNVLFQQMLGRGMRLYPGKEDCLVLDFVDVVRGDGLVTLPTLLGLDPSTVLNADKPINKRMDIGPSDLFDESPPSTDEQLEEQFVDPTTGIRVSRIRVLEYDNPRQLIDDCSGTPPSLWRMTQNAWVNVGPDKFVLEASGVNLRIERTSSDGLFRCFKRVRSRYGVEEQVGGKQPREGNRDSSPSSKARKHTLSKGQYLPLSTDAIEDCFHAVDTWIAANIKKGQHDMRRNAKWRRSPATPAQINFLKKLGMETYEKVMIERKASNVDEAAAQSPPLVGGRSVSNGQPSEERRVITTPLEQGHLTRGQAANLITRLVNGAGKKWDEYRKMQAKKSKMAANDFNIHVGPIPPPSPSL